MARLKAPALSSRDLEARVLLALGGDPGAAAPSALRLTLPLDPEAARRAGRLAADAAVRLHDGASGTSWLGLEPALDRRFDETGELARFRSVEQALDELRAGLVELVPADPVDPAGELRRVEALADRPLGFVGFAFDVAPSDDPLWRAWPSARLIVPGVLLTDTVEGPRGEPEAALTLTALGRGRTLAQAARELAEAGARLEAGLQGAGRIRGHDADHGAPPTGHEASADHAAEPAEAFEGRVAAAREAVRLGYLDKVVLARSDALPAVEPGRLLEALRRQEPDALCFLVRESSAGEAFVGATPERLVRQRDGRIETHALAGTAPRGGSDAEDDQLGAALLASAKDRLEQAVVDDTLRRELGAFNLEPEEVGAPRLRRLARVQHLETPLVLRFRDRPASILEVAARLHPTPALGGLPRGRARTWLRDREPLNRGWYGGLVGWVGARPHEGLLAVAIRSALLEPGRTHAFAGVGVVAGSDPAAEWRESELKLATVREALRDATADPEAGEAAAES